MRTRSADATLKRLPGQVWFDDSDHSTDGPVSLKMP
jgi:hypothetical protein